MTRTTDEIRAGLIDLLSDLQRERDVMPHAPRRLGQPQPVNPASLRYRSISAAIDHMLNAVNELGWAIAEEDSLFDITDDRADL